MALELESKETLLAVIDAAKGAVSEVGDGLIIKLQNGLRELIADAAAALDGWQVTVNPITIRLDRSLKK